MNRLTQMQLMHLVTVIAGQHEMAKEHNINKISVAHDQQCGTDCMENLKTTALSMLSKRFSLKAHTLKKIHLVLPLV